MRTNPTARESGFILVSVAMIGLLSTLLMAGVLSHSVLLEQRAVEQRLSEIRAYWAAQGHFRYAFSRIRQDYLCPHSTGVCPPNDSLQSTAMATVLQSYLDEITSHRRFTYPEESANYWIDIGMIGIRDPAGTHLHSQHLIMRSSLPNTQSTLPVLAGLAQRASPLEIRFCVHLATWNTPCGDLASNNFGGTLNGIYRIKRFALL